MGHPLAIWAWLLPTAVLGAGQPQVDVRRDQDHYFIQVDADLRNTLETDRPRIYQLRLQAVL